jgi:hypothetical protein
MTVMKLFSIAALLAAFSLPLAVSAQQVQQPNYPQAGSPQAGAPQVAPAPRHHGNRWMRLMSTLNLSPDQQQQVQNAIGQWAQSHPAGSPRDPQGARALRQQIFGILSPQQQAQLQQEIMQARQAHQQRMQQRQQMQQQQQMQPQQGQAPPPGAQPPSR